VTETAGSTSVLVFSNDTLSAALLGAAVEAVDYAPVFPLEDESPRDAIIRVRPGAALVDCDHEESCTEAFFGPALMVGVRVAVFSSARSARTLAPIAEEFDVRQFTLPIDLDQLSALLADLTKRVEA
jgi:hypothetical protein